MALEKCSKCGFMHYQTDPCRAAKPETIRIRKYREAHPDRHAAQMAVTHALRNGTLVRQPCEVCGIEKSEAHHFDYSKPLEVKWLCKEHHTDEHHGTDRKTRKRVQKGQPRKDMRKGDRHPPGYQAQKQREYRKRAKAKTT